MIAAALLLAALSALVLPLDVAVLAWMFAAGVLMLVASARGLEGR